MNTFAGNTNLLVDSCSNPGMFSLEKKTFTSTKQLVCKSIHIFLFVLSSYYLFYCCFYCWIWFATSHPQILGGLFQFNQPEGLSFLLLKSFHKKKNNKPQLNTYFLSRWSYLAACLIYIWSLFLRQFKV